MPCTVDAAELSRMQEAGEIKDCIVEGPLSMDIALYKEAAEEKGALGRKVAGDADILVFPDIHAGNLVALPNAFGAERRACQYLH